MAICHAVFSISGFNIRFISHYFCTLQAASCSHGDCSSTRELDAMKWTLIRLVNYVNKNKSIAWCLYQHISATTGQ